jgi:DNA repair photolyase
MNELVEQVARAIAEADATETSRQLLLTSESYMNVARKLATAVIPVVLEHLREPTDEMVEAGFRAREPGMNMGQSATATWQAMLAAAIRAGTPG